MLKKNRVEITFAISLTLHLLMLLAVSVHFPKVKPEQKIEIAFLEPMKKESQIHARPAPPRQALQAPRKMVSQDEKVTDEKESEDAKYLSEHNQKIAKQTRAAKFAQFKNSKNGAREKLTVGDSEIVLKKTAKKLPQPDDEDESATDDKIIADKGLVTLINSRAFKYYAYCKRIKDKIQILWEPQIKAKVLQHLSGDRFLASLADDERTTRTVIILDAKGMLVSVQVIGTSGLEDMDASAVEAFRAAAPFPDPPIGIIDPDGKIRIRWDFVLSDAK